MKTRFYHCRKRAKERYNLDLNYGHIANLEDRIRRYYKVKLLQIKSDDISVYEIEYRHNKLITIYSQVQRRIKTFLPINARETIK
jgi:hypothetical protein